MLQLLFLLLLTSPLRRMWFSETKMNEYALKAQLVFKSQCVDLCSKCRNHSHAPRFCTCDFILFLPLGSGLFQNVMCITWYRDCAETSSFHLVQWVQNSLSWYIHLVVCGVFLPKGICFWVYREFLFLQFEWHLVCLYLWIGTNKPIDICTSFCLVSGFFCGGEGGSG